MGIPEKAPEEAYFFQDGSWSHSEINVPAQREMNRRIVGTGFQKAQLTDLNWRSFSRVAVAGAILALLFLQNSALFFLICKTFKYGQLIQLQWFFGTLVAGTLAETYSVLRFMVQWLFKDVPYKPDHRV